jgi:hypothetical protein
VYDAHLGPSLPCQDLDIKRRDVVTYSKKVFDVSLMLEVSPTFNPAKLDYVLMPPN